MRGNGRAIPQPFIEHVLSVWSDASWTTDRLAAHHKISRNTVASRLSSLRRAGHVLPKREDPIVKSIQTRQEKVATAPAKYMSKAEREKVFASLSWHVTA